MRICVLQFHPQSLSSKGVVSQDNVYDPSRIGPQHTLEYRFIFREWARTQIDTIVQEGFDFFFNLLWGTLKDAPAEIQVNQYFGSQKVPSAGVRGFGLFCTESSDEITGQHEGSLVPRTQEYLSFTKRQGGRATPESGMISTDPDVSRLKYNTCSVSEGAYSSKGGRASALGLADAGDPEGCTDSQVPLSRPIDNFRAQRPAGNAKYTVTVVEMGNCAMALSPCYVESKKPLRKGDQPVLFEHLQHAALDAFEASVFRGGHMGCDMDLHLDHDGLMVTNANPRSLSFLQPKCDPRDLKLAESFPGGLNALVNVFITNSSLHYNTRKELSKVAASYDAVAPKYDEQGQSNSDDENNFKDIVDKYEFDGHVVDLACGTGFFGRVLRKHKNQTSLNTMKLVGFDLSPGMAQVCRETGLYGEVYVAGMQACLLQYPSRDEIDHIVCFGAAHFLTPEEFSYFLVQCFLVANKSITIAVDEIPDSYNLHLHDKGVSHMHSINHLAGMKEFGEPEGWRLVYQQRRFSWKSPTTGDDVYSTFFRFERVDEKKTRMTRAVEKN